jgi:hypothetical protein
MQIRSGLLKRSIALGGVVGLAGIAAVALTPTPAQAFIGVEVGPLGVGIGSTEPAPPPVVYSPPPAQPSVVVEQPPTYTYTPSYTYTPAYPSYYYGSDYTVVYPH